MIYQEVTSNNFEFLLIPHKVTVGTVTPTKYFVITDNTGKRISTIYERESMAIEYDTQADYELHPSFDAPLPGSPPPAATQEEGWALALEARRDAPEQAQVLTKSLGNLGGNVRRDSGFRVSAMSNLASHEFQFGAVLGKGSFGIVYQASFRGTDVAVKKFDLDLERDAESAQWFVQEIMALSELNHPHVLRFIGVCIEKPDKFWLATEFLSNGSVGSLARKRGVPLGWDRVVKIAVDVAKGMSYLHSRSPKVVHRDIKGDNLFLDEAYKTVIGDLGLTRLKSSMRTMTNCGSPIWCAPEILFGRQYNEVGANVVDDSLAHVVDHSDALLPHSRSPSTSTRGASPCTSCCRARTRHTT